MIRDIKTNYRTSISFSEKEKRSILNGKLQFRNAIDKRTGRSFGPVDMETVIRTMEKTTLKGKTFHVSKF